MITSNDIGKVVSFSVYPSGIIPTSFSHVTVAGILNPRNALTLSDVITMHANVFPTLPVGSPSKYSDYNYVQVEFPDGTQEIVGMAWIDNSSIVIHENVQIQAIISDVNASDLEGVRQALIANGYSHITLTLL